MAGDDDYEMPKGLDPKSVPPLAHKRWRWVCGQPGDQAHKEPKDDCAERTDFIELSG